MPDNIVNAEPLERVFRVVEHVKTQYVYYIVAKSAQEAAAIIPKLADGAEVAKTETERITVSSTRCQGPAKLPKDR